MCWPIRERGKAKIQFINVTARFQKIVFFLPWVNSPQWAKAPSLLRNPYDTQLETPQSVVLLWTSDQPDAETYA
jgi:hypothetical protein